jgi:transposase
LRQCSAEAKANQHAGCIIFRESTNTPSSSSDAVRWPRNFAQGVKWNLGLTAGMLCLRIRSDDEEASPPEPHTGLQGESGLGCLEERSTAQLAEQFDVHPNQISSWKEQLLAGAADVFERGGNSKSSASEVDVKSLHAKIGELVLENDFLERALGKAGFPSAKR